MAGPGLDHVHDLEAAHLELVQQIGQAARGRRLDVVQQQDALALASMPVDARGGRFRWSLMWVQSSAMKSTLQVMYLAIARYCSTDPAATAPERGRIGDRRRIAKRCARRGEAVLDFAARPGRPSSCGT